MMVLAPNRSCGSVLYKKKNESPSLVVYVKFWQHRRLIHARATTTWFSAIVVYHFCKTHTRQFIFGYDFNDSEWKEFLFTKIIFSIFYAYFKNLSLFSFILDFFTRGHFASLTYIESRPDSLVPSLLQGCRALQRNRCATQLLTRNQHITPRKFCPNVWLILSKF